MTYNLSIPLIKFNISLSNQTNNSLEISEKIKISYFINQFSSESKKKNMKNKTNTTATFSFEIIENENLVLLSSCQIIGNQYNLKKNTKLRKFELSLGNYTPTQNSRGPFSFKFNFNNIIIWKNSLLILKLGPLAVSNKDTISSNIKCLIYEGNLTYYSESIEYSLNEIAIKLNRDLFFKDKTIIELVCKGGRMPKKFYSSNDTIKDIILSINSFANRSKIIMESNKISISEFNLKKDYKLSFVNNGLYFKEYGFSGLEANYYIKILPGAINYNINSRIYIEFPFSIQEKLNKDNEINCFLDEHWTNCNAKDHRLTISSIKSMKINAKNPYILKITGITQPKELLLYKNIYLALDYDEDINNGINEHIEFSDELNTISPLINLQSLIISNFKLSNYYTMKKMTLYCNVFITGNDNFFSEGDLKLFINFPKEYSIRMLYTKNLNCKFVSKLGIDLAKSCKVKDHNKIEIDLKQNKDDFHPFNYKITIENLLNPHIITEFPIKASDFIFFLTKPENLNKILAISFGLIDYSSFIITLDYKTEAFSWKKINSKNNSLINLPNPLILYQDSFNFEISLIPENTVFSNYFNMKLSSEKFFETNPLKIENLLGFSSSKFYLGPKLNTIPGKYAISFSTQDNNKNFNIDLPPLIVFVEISVCNISSKLNNYLIPINGISLPIIFDFTNCIPIDILKIKGILTDNKSTNFEIYNLNEKTINLNNPKAIFIIKQSKKTKLKPNNNKAKLNLLISHKNHNKYIIPLYISLELLEIKEKALLNNNNPKTAKISMNNNTHSVTIEFFCPQKGFAFYGLGIRKNNNFTLKELYSKTKMIEKMHVIRDQMDSSWNEYGFIVIYDNISLVKKEFFNLRANGQYSVEYFCVNQLNVSSIKTGFNNWTQLDNKGRLSVAKFKFNSKIDNVQKNEIVCALQYLFKIQNERIYSDKVKNCEKNIGKKRILIENNQKKKNGYIFRVFFIPDYSSPLDETTEIIKERFISKKFGGEILNLTSIGSKGYYNL